MSGGGIRAAVAVAATMVLLISVIVWAVTR